MRRYCRWISDGFTAFFVLLALIVYWVVSLRGAMSIIPDITPKKLFLADSPINEMNAMRDTYILPNYTSISVFVNSVGDLSDPSRLDRANQLVGDFESLPNNLGSQFTHYWLRDYIKYLDSSEEEVEVDRGRMFHRSEMRSFLEWPEFRHWNGFIRFDAQNERIDKFFVTLAFHGDELVQWKRRGEYLNLWRGIADRYPDLGAFVWVEEAQFLDQIETLVPATIQSSLATLACMMIVCFLFMTNLFTVVVATISILSICIGVFGFLAYWNIDLDPVSMACIIMSIGFSVDFPSHTIYHYHRCGKEARGAPLSSEQRIYYALVAVGFPLLQCGLSTILFVLCLLFVDTYMSEVFVKTIVLVVSLGLLHGLFICPAILCTLSNVHSVWLSSSVVVEWRRKTSAVINNRRRRGTENVIKVSIAGPA